MTLSANVPKLAIIPPPSKANRLAGLVRLIHNVAISRAVRFGSILLGVTKDVTSEWTIPLDEGLETGLVKEIGGLIMENDK